jgi:aminomethyltransferase
MNATLHRTPLFDLMQPLHARMTGFAGWEMPVQFQGILQEHQAVRTAAGLFDISHMGKFTLQGSDVLNALQPLVPSDLSQLQPGQAQYTVLLNPQGGIVDDLIFYYQGTSAGQQRWLAIVNAATTAQDKAWLLEHLEAESVQLVEGSTETALIALQGPQATQHLQALVAADLSQVKPFGHRQIDLLGQSAFVARTGYTGEDGFEIMVDAAMGRSLWQALLQAGVVPCGLGARDTLRLEAAMCLYGQDIDQTTTPLEAGLGWLVHLDHKGEFIGRQVLERQKAEGVKQRLVGLQLAGRNIARHDYEVWASGQPVGKVTSGTLSPTLGYPIALAYVPPQWASVGQALEVSIRGKLCPATVVKRPFYRAQR